MTLLCQKKALFFQITSELFTRSNDASCDLHIFLAKFLLSVYIGLDW